MDNIDPRASQSAAGMPSPPKGCYLYQNLKNRNEKKESDTFRRKTSKSGLWLLCEHGALISVFRKLQGDTYGILAITEGQTRWERKLVLVHLVAFCQ